MEINFITGPQYAALKEHFENVLESTKDDESCLQRIRAEFSRLLQAFGSCYEENQRKTGKIFELKALLSVKASEVNGEYSTQEDTVKDLRASINQLQRNLDSLNEQRRELIAEIHELKKNTDTEDKSVQLDSNSLESLPQENIRGSLRLLFQTYKGGTDLKREFQQIDSCNQKVSEITAKEERETNDTKVLRNNLEILIADLKLSRRLIQELKTEIHTKESLLKDVCRDLSVSQVKLAQAETKFQEIKKPIEMKLDHCETELGKKRRQLEDISKQLEKAAALNVKLSAIIATNNSTIEDLESKVEDLRLAKESTIKKAGAFEKHLAESHCYVETLKLEVETLKDEVMALKKQIPTEVSQQMARNEKGKSMDTDALERTIDSLKNHLSVRDKKLRQMEEELRGTIEILQSLKMDFAGANKEKTNLESDIQNLKNVLKNKTGDVKLLKEKLIENKKETAEVKRDLQFWIKKYRQAVDKKNKFHNMYNHLKIMNSEQKNENTILGKRQQYLVKILKEKDMEIEKVVTWKRCIY